MADSPLAGNRIDLVRCRESFLKTAASTSWLAAHQWGYGTAVAQATARDVREKLMLRPDDDVLEIGSGSGAFLLAVLHAGQGGIGFDLCDALVRARDRFHVDKDRIKLGVAEAAHLPAASDSFDKILCYSVTHYFPDDRYLENSLREMLRVCRPGGLILLGDVAGVMERTRKILVQAGVPARIADASLWIGLPVRNFYRACRGSTPRVGRFYRRSRLRRLLDQLPCSYEFLDQNICGRPASEFRFDIRIHKTA